MNTFLANNLTGILLCLSCSLSHAQSANNILDEFATYKADQQKDFEQYQKINREETQSYKARILKKWDVAELSNKTLWVEYCDSFYQRNKVDFVKGVISITRIQRGNSAKTSLTTVLSTFISKTKIQAYQDDSLSRAIEKRSIASIKNIKTAQVKAEPIFLPLITGKDNVTHAELDTLVTTMLAHKRIYKSRGRKGQQFVTLEVPLYIDGINEQNAKIVTSKAASQKTKPLIAKKTSNKTTTNSTISKQKKTATTALVLSTSDKAGTKGWPKKSHGIKHFVHRQSKKHRIAPEVILAIVEAESSFNPMARSGIPAYGLMQIVPKSAGQDATKKIFGEAKILAPSYLYNSEKNIEIGAAYLNILYYRYLKSINDPLSRLYCTIAAYNTGAGNVAKAFTGKMRIGPAADKINRMKPEDVYRHLLTHLPYQETRHYLKKVNRLVNKYRV